MCKHINYIKAFSNSISSWDELQVQSWAFEELEDPEVVGVDVLTSVFMPSDIEMSYGRYWITVAMKPASLPGLQ